MRKAAGGALFALSLIALFFTAPLAIHRTVESVLRAITSNRRSSRRAVLGAADFYCDQKLLFVVKVKEAAEWSERFNRRRFGRRQ